MGDSESLREFWKSKEGQPTVETMMLNPKANEFNQTDLEDVLGGLPDFSNMNIIELGAGIGRFTSHFAKKGKSVYASDFMQNFINKNKEVHDSFENIKFHVGHANEIEMEPNSIDLVFSNWLFMYLVDKEVIDLLQNVLQWLVADGYFHFRESCSESSKRDGPVLSMNDNQMTLDNSGNPTHYRHICQYINLMKQMTIVDENDENKRYGFHILWAKSIPTYIEKFDNWRQVQMLIKKVQLSSDSAVELSKDSVNGFGHSSLLSVLGQDTISEQIKFDRELICGQKIWDGRTPFSKPLLQILEDACQTLGKPNVVLNIVDNSNFAVSPFEIADDANCLVVDVETCVYPYNNFLAQANANRNKKVRLHWLEQLDGKNEWSLPVESFDRAIGCRLFKNSVKRFDCHQFLLNVKCRLNQHGCLLLLEEIVDANAEADVMKNFHDVGFKRVETVHVATESFKDALLKVASVSLDKLNRQSVLYGSVAQSKWLLIKAFV